MEDKTAKVIVEVSDLLDAAYDRGKFIGFMLGLLTGMLFIIVGVLAQSIYTDHLKTPTTQQVSK